MSSTHHVAVCGMVQHSHNRGLTCLVGNLLLHRSDLFITFFCPVNLRQKSEDILFDKFKLDEATRSRLRLVYVDPTEAVDETGGKRGAFFQTGQVTIDQHYDQLVAGTATHDFARPPDAIIADCLSHCLVDHAKRKGYKGPTFLFVAWEASVGAVWHERCRLALEGDGSPALVEVNGLPPKYSYEYKCTTPAIEPVKNPNLIPPMWSEYHRSAITGQHRHIWSFSRELVPQGMDVLAGYDLKAPVTHILPQYSPDFWNTTPSFPPDPLFVWLDQQAKQSVVFITFGSMWFPSVFPWQLETLVDALLNADLRFVLLFAPETASWIKDTALVERVKQRIMSTGNLWTGFVDQCLALRHEAIGWVLHHGGAGCTIETLVYGHPAILWPFGWDQPANASMIVDLLDAGWELFEPRDKLIGLPIASRPGYQVQTTPESLKQELDLVFGELKGPNGERKRANAQRAGKLLRDEHARNVGKYLDELLALMYG